ncbi:hypothetical protein [Aliikangiella sp. IMCC44632]
MNTQSASQSEAAEEKVDVSSDTSTLLSELKLLTSQIYECYRYKVDLHCKLLKNEWEMSLDSAAFALALLLVFSAIVMTGWFVISAAIGAALYSFGLSIPIVLCAVLLIQIVLGAIVWRLIKLTIMKIGFSKSLSYLRTKSE